MDKSLLGEFQLDWRLAGKTSLTATNYMQWLEHLLARYPEPTLMNVKEWLASTPSVSSRRKRGQAVRAFGAWAEHNNYEVNRTGFYAGGMHRVLCSQISLITPLSIA